MTQPNRVTIDQARQNAAAIRKVWRAGQRSVARLQQLQRKDPAALQHGRKMDTYTQEAQRLGTNIDTAAKMRRLAREYAAEHIEAVCALVERDRSRFGPTHLLSLLRVRDQALAGRLGVSRPLVTYQRSGSRPWSNRFREKVAAYLAGSAEGT